jgi:hypothetical protein|tara:strand:+ start:611 stop:1132 length:522 start_codon:yes stop_codon:yes gene_type:complete
LKIIFSILLFISSFSQSQTYFLLSDVQKKYIEYKLFTCELIDHALYQPYSDVQIADILFNDSTLLGHSINLFINRSDTQTKLGTSIKGFIGDNKLLATNKIAINTFGFYNKKNIIAGFNYRADSKYQEDEIYFGSEGKFGSKVIGRITHSYIQYQKNKIRLFFWKAKPKLWIN